jgi:aquaporin Z
MLGRSKIAAFVAEFLGTGTLTLVVYTIVARTSFPLFSAIAAGTVVAMFTVAMENVSGANLNPAITFGLWTIRKLSTVRAIVYIIAQALGGLAAWSLLKYFLGHNLTSVAGASFEWKVFVAEALGGMIFALGFAAAVVQRFQGGKLAATIGLSLTAGILVASLASNGVLNPAVAVGIQSWSWAYATAPLAGALVGMNVYGMLFSEVPINVAARRGAKVRSTPVVKARTTTKKKTTRKK